MPEPPQDLDRDDDAQFWRDQRSNAAPRGRRRDWTTDPDRIASLQVGCPHCHAPPDSVCRNHELDAELTHLPCHPIRLTEARRTT